MFAEQSLEHDDSRVNDNIVVLHGATWADFQRLLELRGDAAGPRIAFLEGDLEIMAPSRSHESLKSVIGRLIEAWCLERGIEFSPYGSWTLEKKDDARGIEPDECYVFGIVEAPLRPDLAIEVVWTSGGVNKLAIYAKLGIREVWIWRRGRIGVHVLREAGYEPTSASEVLAGIDVAELARYLDRPTASQAIREYRAALQRQNGR
jgi:Uma2 family endonuclease